MTVSSTSRLAGPFWGTGAAASLPFDFKVFADTDLEVTRDGSALTLDSHYTVTLNADQDVAPGGTVLIAAAANTSGAEIYVAGATPVTQETVLPSQSPWYPKVIERALDKLTLIAQEVDGRITSIAASVSALAISVATAVADAAAAAQAAIDSAIFTVTGASGQTVSTRTLLAGIATPVVGQTAYLTEAGRQGWWQCIAVGDAEADTYQGLYVLSTADLTKAWRRIVEDNTYQASWWGIPGTSATNHLRINAMNALIPEGSTVVWPPETILTVGSIIWTTDSIVFRGHGDASRIQWDEASGVTGVHMFQLAASSITMRDFRMTGIRAGAPAAGAPHCIIVSAYDGGAPRLIENIHLENLTLDGASTVLGFFADSDNTTTFIRPRNITTHNLRIKAGKQGVSIFGAENVAMTSTLIELYGEASTIFTAPFRILGSKNVRVDGFTAIGNGYGRSDNSGVYLDSANVAANGTDMLRAQNEDIYFSNGRFTNVFVGVFLVECLGELIFDNVEFAADRDATVATIGVRIEPSGAPGGVQNEFGTAIFRNSKLDGFATACTYFGPGKRLTFDGCGFVSNARPADGSAQKFLYSAFGGVSLVELFRNRAYADDGGINTTVGAAEFFYAKGNVLGEGAVTNAPVAVVAGTLTGTVVDEDNYQYPVGVRAAL